jgi:hypothetical protein
MNDFFLVCEWLTPVYLEIERVLQRSLLSDVYYLQLLDYVMLGVNSNPPFVHCITLTLSLIL